MKDNFSRWVCASALRTQTAEEIARALERDLLMIYGVPEVLFSDMAPNLTGLLMQSVARLLGIKLVNTTGYHPQPNSVERAHKDLAVMLRSAMIDTKQHWINCLPTCLYSMNTAVNQATGLPPFLLVFGRDAATPLDHIFRTPNRGDYATEHAFAKALLERVQIAHEYARTRLSVAVRRQRRLHSHEQHLFVPGKKVLLFTPRAHPGVSRKLSQMFSGPWIVCSSSERGNTIRIASDPSWATKIESKIVNIDRLKPYFGPDVIPPAKDGEDIPPGETAEYFALPAPKSPPTTRMARGGRTLCSGVSSGRRARPGST